MNFAFMSSGDMSGGLSMVITMGIMLLMLWLLVFMPQRKQEKKDKAMRDSMDIGDEVTTIGGVVGRVVAIKDDTFVLETGSDRVKIRFRKSAVSSLEKLQMENK